MLCICLYMFMLRTLRWTRLARRLSLFMYILRAATLGLGVAISSVGRLFFVVFVLYFFFVGCHSPFYGFKLSRNKHSARLRFGFVVEFGRVFLFYFAKFLRRSPWADDAAAEEMCSRDCYWCSSLLRPYVTARAAAWFGCNVSFCAEWWTHAMFRAHRAPVGDIRASVAAYSVFGLRFKRWTRAWSSLAVHITRGLAPFVYIYIYWLIVIAFRNEFLWSYGFMC